MTDGAQNYYFTLSPKGRMAFCTLVDPKKFKENGIEKGEPMHTAEVLFDPEDIKHFRIEDPNDPDKLQEVDLAVYLSRIAKETWGEDFNVREAVASGDLHWPIHKGETIAQRRKGETDHYAGKKVINIKTGDQYPPGLFYKDDQGKDVKIKREVASDMDRARKMFYSGSYIRFECNIKPRIVSGRRYLTFYVNSADFLESGDRLGGGGGRSLRDRDNTSGGSSEHNPMAGMEEDIPA